MTFGVAVTPYQPVLPLTEIRADVAASRVPTYSRNSVLPLARLNGGVWLFHLADGIVEAFDSRGVRQWSRPVAVPGVEGIQRAFFSENHRTLPRQVYTEYRLFADAKEIGSHVWVLINSTPDQGTTLLILAQTGAVAATLRVPSVHGAKGFAVDVTRGFVYLSVPDAAELAAARLPMEMREYH